MSRLNINKLQIGLSGTATQNFHLEVPDSPNGTMRLARGNVGAALSDIFTVNAAGEVDFPQMIRSIGATGYIKLPGGLIVQWGTGSFSTAGSAISFPISFPTACRAVLLGQGGNGGGFIYSLTPTQTGFTGYTSAGTTGNHFWLAIGH